MLQGIKNEVLFTKELYQNNQYFSSYSWLSFGGPFDMGWMWWRHDIPSIENAKL